jgi:hypothetical protein
MIYTWAVTGMKGIDLPNEPNAIIQTYWTKTGVDEQGNKGMFSGATPFSPSSIDPENFIPYDQLTEEIVLGWIQAVVVGSYAEHVDAQIQKQIDALKIKEEPLPWAPTTTTSTTTVAPKTTTTTTTVAE